MGGKRKRVQKGERKRRRKGDDEEEKTLSTLNLFSSLLLFLLFLTVRGPRGLGLVELLMEGPVRSQALGRAVVGGAAVAAAAAQADDALKVLRWSRG